MFAFIGALPLSCCSSCNINRRIYIWNGNKTPVLWIYELPRKLVNHLLLTEVCPCSQWTLVKASEMYPIRGSVQHILIFFFIGFASLKLWFQGQDCFKFFPERVRCIIKHVAHFRYCYDIEFLVIYLFFLPLCVKAVCVKCEKHDAGQMIICPVIFLHYFYFTLYFIFLGISTEVLLMNVPSIIKSSWWIQLESKFAEPVSVGQIRWHHIPEQIDSISF